FSLAPYWNVAGPTTLSVAVFTLMFTPSENPEAFPTRRLAVLSCAEDWIVTLAAPPAAPICRPPLYEPTPKLENVTVAVLPVFGPQTVKLLAPLLVAVKRDPGS